MSSETFKVPNRMDVRFRTFLRNRNLRPIA